jgi:hypothetical protein
MVPYATVRPVTDDSGALKNIMDTTKTQIPVLGRNPAQEAYNEMLFAPVVVHRILMDGVETTLSVSNAKVGYSSDYWRSMPDGEHKLFFNLGGIACRFMPKIEKKSLKQYFHEHCRIHTPFTGTAIVQNYGGELRSITATEK